MSNVRTRIHNVDENVGGNTTLNHPRHTLRLCPLPPNSLPLRGASSLPELEVLPHFHHPKHSPAVSGCPDLQRQSGHQAKPTKRQENLSKKQHKNQNCITLQEFGWHSRAHKTTSWEKKSFTEVTGDIAAHNELTISLQQMGYLLFLNHALVLKQQWYLYCTSNHKSRKVVS